MNTKFEARAEWRFPALRDLPVRRILVIKLRGIGDVLLSSIVTSNLRAAFPKARIDFLTEPPSRDMISGNPFIDELVLFQPGVLSTLRMFGELHRRKYDLVFDLFCNPRSAQMTFATCAPVRVGYPFRGRAYAYTVHVRSRSDAVHTTEFNLDTLAALDIPIRERRIIFPLPADAEAWAVDYCTTLGHDGLLVGISCSGTWESKRWKLPSVAAFADAIAERYGALPLLLWGPGERDDVEFVLRSMKQHAVIAPPTTLKQMGALLSRCDVVLANNSSPLHIAEAVGTPVLGIFGPTNPHLQGPILPESEWVRKEDLDCLGCNYTTCPIGNICMTELSIESVLTVFDSVVRRLEKQHNGDSRA